MKLRHNFGDVDLDYCFGIDKSTVYRYFSKWLELLHICKAIVFNYVAKLGRPT